MKLTLAATIVIIATALTGCATTNQNHTAPTNKTMQTRVTPFLMFEGKAEEAINLYLSLLPDSRVESIARYAAGEPGPEGSVKVATFILAGQRIMCSDTYVKHGFTFTPSTSLFVDCTSENQLQELFAKLSQGGQIMMPLDNYGFSQKFAWVSDRFGVSWQLNLP